MPDQPNNGSTSILLERVAQVNDETPPFLLL